MVEEKSFVLLCGGDGFSVVYVSSNSLICIREVCVAFYMSIIPQENVKKKQKHKETKRKITPHPCHGFKSFHLDVTLTAHPKQKFLPFEQDMASKTLYLRLKERIGRYKTLILLF